MNIVHDGPALNECRLRPINKLIHKNIEQSSENFRNDLIKDGATRNWLKLMYLRSILCFRDKDDRSMIPLFKKFPDKKKYYSQIHSQ